MAGPVPDFVITVLLRADNSPRYAPDAAVQAPLVELEVFCKWQHLDDEGTVDVIPLGALDPRPIVLDHRDRILEQVRAALVDHGDQLRRALEQHPVLPSLPEQALDFARAAVEVDVDTQLGGLPGHRFPVTRTNIPDGERRPET